MGVGSLMKNHSNKYARAPKSTRNGILSSYGMLGILVYRSVMNSLVYLDLVVVKLDNEVQSIQHIVGLSPMDKFIITMVMMIPKQCYAMQVYLVGKHFKLFVQNDSKLIFIYQDIFMFYFMPRWMEERR